ncbi:MAG: tetratricopeptide repeat protein [Candidatus Latescibacterota bacterium]|nr:tetratricopeptide repeat protein [Candidatus Latescibacterota bacterium]
MKATAQLFPLAPSRRLWLAYAGIACLLAWLCFGSLADHLLFTHDDEIALDYPRLSADPTFFFSPDKAMVSGRLVDELVMWAAYAAWGDNPALFHLLSVACHVLASLVLTLAYHRLCANLELSMVAGLLFLLNVTHIQAVHWISALEYPLATLLVAAAAYRYGAYAATPSPVRLTAFYALAAIGLLAHIAALMLWPFCLLWSIGQGRGWHRTLRELIPLALLLLPVLYLVAQITPSRASTFEAASSYSADQALPLLADAARTLLWFAGRLLSTAHWLPFPPHARPGWEEALGLVVVVGLGILIWRRTTVAVWAAWTLLFIVPFLVLPERFIHNLAVGPSRYLYFASAGSSLILAWGLQRVGLLLGSRGRWAFTCAVLAILAISYVTLKRTEGLTYYSEARSYLSAGDDPTGIGLMRKALALGGGAVYREDAYARLCLAQITQPDRGAADLARARVEFPDHPAFVAYALVIQSMERGDPDRAFGELLAMGEDADIAELVGKAYYNIARSFSADDNHERAALAYGRSLQFLPDRRHALEQLAAALWASDQREQATAVLLYLTRLNPGDPDALYNAALAFNLQGQHRRAIELCRRVLAIAERADARRLLAASASAE